MTPERCAELLAQLLRQKLAQNDSSLTATEVRNWLSAARREEGGKGGGVQDTAHQTAMGRPVSSSSSATERSTATDVSVDSTARLDEFAQYVGLEHGLTEDESTAVSKCLEYGLHPVDLWRYFERVAHDPSLIKRRKRPSIKTAFRSVKQVCKVLGVPYEPVTESWLVSFDVVWQRHYGAPIPYGIAAKVLRPLCKQHGPLEVQRRLDIYCAATEAAYVSLPKFGATWGAWGSTPSRGKGMRGLPGADAAAEFLG
jgi:hypothetical protein